MDDRHPKPLLALLGVMMDIQCIIFYSLPTIAKCKHVLNLAMMDIQYVIFYSLPTHNRLWTCAKPYHFCSQLSKLFIIS